MRRAPKAVDRFKAGQGGKRKKNDVDDFASLASQGARPSRSPVKRHVPVTKAGTTKTPAAAAAAASEGDEDEEDDDADDDDEIDDEDEEEDLRKNEENEEGEDAEDSDVMDAEEEEAAVTGRKKLLMVSQHQKERLQSPKSAQAAKSAKSPTPTKTNEVSTTPPAPSSTSPVAQVILNVYLTWCVSG